MTTTHNLRFFLVACAIIVALSARADGEERNEAGTRWVDPVEFYHLQDVSRTDFTRDYDQGDIDFNRVLKEKGVKVYGLRLKPVAGAAWVEKYLYVFSPDDCLLSGGIDYQDIYGIRGAPLSEAGFCVYADEPVSRSYSFDYTWNNRVGMSPRKRDYKRSYMHKDPVSNHVTSTASIDISNLMLVPSANGGVGLSYALTAMVTDINSEGKFYYSIDMRDSDGVLEHNKISKPNGVDERFGRFIYFRGAHDLLVMLSANFATPALPETFMSSQRYSDLSNHPWPRVYFIVEQILVEDEGGVSALTDIDKEELANYAGDLLAWLRGEGDPLGLGEHTGATESVVINALATVLSLILGTGLVGIAGGTGASIASGMTNAILSGAAGSMPPPMPNMPNIDGIQPPKRPEEEKQSEAPPPPPTEPPVPDPFAGETFNKYVTQDADGDLTVRDPATGKETIYINNGDGTYKNLTTGQDWTPEEINEQLDYRDRNSDLLRQDAEQAAKSQAEQRAQWDAQNERDRERGYSDEAKEYADWKNEQENKLNHELLLDKLALQYHVSPTDKAVMEAIKFEQTMNQIDSETYRDLGDQWDKGVGRLEVTEKVCDAGVNIMATCVPGGTVVKNVYTFAKEPLVGLSEAVAEDKGVSGAIGNVVVGMGKGALGVIQNEAGNLTKDMPNAAWREYGVTILTENLKTGMAEYYKEGNLAKTSDAMIKATGTKSVEFGFSKLINLGFDKLKGSSPADSWLNKPKSLGIGTRADVYKIRVDGNVSLNDNISKLGISTGDGVGKLTKIIGVSKTPGFSTFYSGKVDLGGMAEGTINEIANKTGVHNWGGSLAQADVAMRVEGLSYVIYGADKAADYINGLGETAMKYAKNDS